MSGKNSFPVVNIFQIFKYFNHITRLGPVNSQASMNVAFHKIFHLMSLDFLMINLICLGSLSYSCCLFFFCFALGSDILFHLSILSWFIFMLFGFIDE